MEVMVLNDELRSRRQRTNTTKERSADRTTQKRVAQSESACQETARGYQTPGKIGFEGRLSARLPAIKRF